MVETAASRINSLALVGRDGLRVPQAQLSMLPDAAKLVFRGRAPSWPVAGEAFGVELPRAVNCFNANGGRKALCLGPDEWMLEAVGEDPTGLFSRLSSSLSSDSCSLVDVSHRSDGLAITGMMSEYVLNHGCPLDLSEQQFPIGMCTRTLLGKSPIVLSRTERATFHIDVWRSFSTYVWSLLDEARQEFLAAEV